MTKLFKTIIVAFAVFYFVPSHAALTPISVNIVPPVQFPPSDYMVTGVRASVLWGQHRDMYGIDLGLLGNITDQDFTGIAVSGVFNYTKGTTNVLGLQLAGLANYNAQKTNVYGVQLALGLNSNKAASNVVGLQLALANISAFTDIYGVQLGVYNRAKDVYGLQIGLVNVADNLHGIQIGLINFNHKGLIGMCPLINIGF